MKSMNLLKDWALLSCMVGAGIWAAGCNDGTKPVEKPVDPPTTHTEGDDHKHTEGDDHKHTDGDMKPKEGEAKPAEGEAKPAEGETKPAEGEAKPAEGEAKPAEGEAKPAETSASKPKPKSEAGSTISFGESDL